MSLIVEFLRLCTDTKILLLLFANIYIYKWIYFLVIFFSGTANDDIKDFADCVLFSKLGIKKLLKNHSFFFSRLQKELHLSR